MAHHGLGLPDDNCLRSNARRGALRAITAQDLEAPMKGFLTGVSGLYGCLEIESKHLVAFILPNLVVTSATLLGARSY